MGPVKFLSALVNYNSISLASYKRNVTRKARTLSPDPEIGTMSIDWAKLSTPPEDRCRFQFRNVGLNKKKTRRWIMSEKSVILLIYHRHEISAVIYIAVIVAVVRS
jgi:hypothetical protein